MNFSDVKLPSNRKFGFFFTVIFTIAGVYFFIEGGARLAYILLTLALLFVMTAIIKADLLLPLNKLWMHFGLLLGMIVSPIVLGVIFFGLFTPIAIFMRLFGRDELRLKLCDRATHWKERHSENTQHDTFKYQF